MGSNQSILKTHGYAIEEEKENYAVATKGDEKFFIKKITMNSGYVDPELTSEVEILKKISHPHIVRCEGSVTDQNIYYLLMKYCQGGNLATKIRGMSRPPSESEALSWIVEICVALRTFDEKGLLHKHLLLENIFLTEFGTVCFSGSGKIHEKYKNMQPNDLSRMENISYLAPEVFTEGNYDTKSDIWSVGCILYELCTQKSAFSAETPIKLMPKIIGGSYPSLSSEEFSPELCQLLNDILKRDPQSRPTASEILQCPFIIDFLTEKCKTTVTQLQTKLDNLRKVAEGLERVHKGTTIGSLAGGVIGAVGGVTSIVGLVLAPFTLGASLIVTGIGVGVGAVGGVAAGASNITKMVNESSDRKAVRNIIEEFKEKTEAVVTWLQEIGNSLQTIRNRCDSADTSEGQNNILNQDNLVRLGSRAVKGLGGVAELVRLARVINIGKVAAQTSRVVRVAEVATGVISGLFVAVDVFFIAMDAKEIQNIRQAETAEERDGTSKKNPEIRSEIMKFVRSIREAADNLQKVLDELKSIISSIPSLQNRGTEPECIDME